MKSVTKMPWSESVWFSDVDDTLITTAASTPVAANVITEILTSKFDSSVGYRIKKEFENIFKIMFEGHTGQNHGNEYEELISHINSFQQEILQKFGKTKLWSREIFMKIAGERSGVSFSPELLYELTDAYWMKLSEVANPFQGVLSLIQTIKQHNRPLYLLTSSDGRLQEKDNGQFLYEPSYSEGFKRERMQLLRQKGIDFNLVSIGDPEDKPDKDFFEKGIHMAERDLGHGLDVSQAIMIGDSFKGDLQTPKEQLGFGLVVLFENGRNETEIVDEHYIKVGNLEEIIQFLV